MRLVLANSDYPQHVTDEGEQLQRGLAESGWLLAGYGYSDHCRHVPTLLDRYRPERVFVQDCRDWRADSPGCFDRRVCFEQWERLRDFPVKRMTVVKDAGTVSDYQRCFCEALAPERIVVYYHPQSVLRVSPWLSSYRLIRTYHSLDRRIADGIDVRAKRAGAIVSGAVSAVYPLRRLAIANAARLGLAVHRHPGYGNSGCATPAYLKLLAGFRVHVACSSAYGFALRKIIESVAMGATPVTDLPAYDELPAIDGALVRVRAGAGLHELREAIRHAAAAWNLDERLAWAEQARSYYDFRAVTRRLSELLIDES